MCNPWGIALLLFLLGLAGTGAAWWHFRDAPAPARAKPVRLASHEAFLSKHSNAHLLEERFEREVQRRRNGGDGALGAQGQADASLGLGAHHAEAAGAGEGHAAVAAGHDDAAHAAASHLDAVHADAHAAAPPSLYDTSIHGEPVALCVCGMWTQARWGCPSVAAAPGRPPGAAAGSLRCAAEQLAGW